MDKLDLRRSAELYRRSAAVVPGGVPGIRGPENFLPGEYPMFMESGRGGRVTDVDGNEYVDLLCAYGPVLIGHAEPEIDAAVKARLDEGFCFDLVQRWQVELMERLTRLVPSAELGIALKTGSDATTAAVRLARAHTGGTKVLRCGYHGWHDWCVEASAGIPESHQEHTLAFPYNDLERAAALFARHRDDVAAIVLTPVGHDFDRQLEEPADGFLAGLRALADEHGALLIFDEVRTGFRLGMGGAQERYGVVPDLTALGKALGNGYAIAALVGRQAVMQTLPEIFVSATYFPNSLEMVAACHVLDFLVREHVPKAVSAKGEWLRSALTEIVSRLDVPASLSPYPEMPFLHFDPAHVPHADTWRTHLYRHAIRAGVFAHPRHHGFVAFRHSDEDLARVAQAFEEGLRGAAKAIR